MLNPLQRLPPQLLLHTIWLNFEVKLGHFGVGTPSPDPSHSAGVAVGVVVEVQPQEVEVVDLRLLVLQVSVLEDFVPRQ